MRRQIAFVLAGLVGVALAHADSKDAEEPIRLLESRRVSLPTLAQGFFALPELCDSDSNFYLAPSTDDGDPDSVVRVSADGQKSVRISLASVPEFVGPGAPRIMTMTLGVDGDLHVIAKGMQGPAYIVSFGPDGKYRSKTKLNVGSVAVRVLGAFHTGEFLVAGTSLSDRKPVLAIVNGTGDLVSSVRASEEGPSDVSTTDATGSLRMAYLEYAQADRDGNIYIAQPSPTGPILQISRYGEVVQRIQLDPPHREARLTRFRVSGRRVVVEHQGARGERKSPPRWLSVYDLSSGERIARYAADAGGLLCYSSVSGLPDSFTLLTSDGKNLQFVQVTGE